jgi:hypothetical protein
MTRASDETPKTRQAAERGARLAKALRENLRRRKAQAKGRASPPPAGEGKKAR